MKLNIGTNIKKLRLAKGYTQEQLADLLNVSSAAVSKWEAQNTYPDITLLFPLAGIFNVSVDELMGYDEAKANAEIEEILAEYYSLRYMRGEFAKARELICDARKTYPSDYRIMYRYMWDLSGGNENNDPKILLDKREEFLQICDCILDGCTEENLRLDALTMKAKLLHAAGDTDRALEILEKFPTWFQSSAQITENLFGKRTPEYKYWSKKNSYGLLDFTAHKLARTIWFENNSPAKERLARIEELGDAFSSLRYKSGMEFFAIPARITYAVLADIVSRGKEIGDVIRVREKEFAAGEAIMALAENDEVLKELIEKTYKTDSVLKWLYDLLMYTKLPRYARLRENPEYMDMLQKWQQKLGI